jgi:hypothetical protein
MKILEADRAVAVKCLSSLCANGRNHQMKIFILALFLIGNFIRPATITAKPFFTSEVRKCGALIGMLGALIFVTAVREKNEKMRDVFFLAGTIGTAVGTVALMGEAWSQTGRRQNLPTQTTPIQSQPSQNLPVQNPAVQNSPKSG